jgi:hypothetical protein
VKSTFFSISTLVINYPFPVHSAQHMSLPHPCLTSISPYSVFPITFPSLLSYSPSWLNATFVAMVDTSLIIVEHLILIAFRPRGNYLISKGLKVTNEQILCSSCIIFWELLGILTLWRLTATIVAIPHC